MWGVIFVVIYGESLAGDFFNLVLGWQRRVNRINDEMRWVLNLRVKFDLSAKCLGVLRALKGRELFDEGIGASGDVMPLLDGSLGNRSHN